MLRLKNLLKISLKRNSLSKVMKVIIIFFLSMFLGCSNIPSRTWKKIDNHKTFLNIQTGDIILKERQYNFLGLFGHVGVMKDSRLVVDYPKLGEHIKIVDINYWIEKDRNFMILRYIGMNKKFKEKFIEILNEYIDLNRPYQVNFNIKSDNGFYCSQFIWYLYYKTAKELEIDIKTTDYFLFLPYDFIYSKEFYIVF